MEYIEKKVVLLEQIGELKRLCQKIKNKVNLLEISLQYQLFKMDNNTEGSSDSSEESL